MAAGWKLKQGTYCIDKITEDEIWQRMNFFYSEGSRKRNSYKFGIIKAVLDSVFSISYLSTGYYLSYEKLFERFTHNYWNLVAKYGLRQMRKDGRSELSKIEKIILTYKEEHPDCEKLLFEDICQENRKKIVESVQAECKKYVLGALFEDFGGYIYSFDLNGSGLYINPAYYDFFVKYKLEIEKINYYEWAKFLETVNDDNVLNRVIDKLELATPKRENLSVYRYVLEVEFEQNNCFYCGKRLGESVHVDHFVPWSFVKYDMAWNFVLACPTCNIKKSNKLPSIEYLMALKTRNERVKGNISNLVVVEQFADYSDSQLERMWQYAKISGLREFTRI